MNAELALPVADPASPEAGELARRAAAGDARAFEALVGRHHGSLVRLARAILASGFEAEDLVQECWTEAWLRLGDLRDPARFLPWLRRSVVRRAVRAARRRPLRPDPETLAALAAPASPAGARVEVETALAALSPRQRAVFLLVEVDGFGAAEAAAQLGLAAATVRVHRLLARRKLRALFRGSRP